MKEKRTKSETTQTFATRLQGLANQHKANVIAQGQKYSQGKLADSCGIKRPAFDKYLDDNMEIGINSLVKIAKYFNVSTDYLLGLTDAAPANPSKRAVCEATGLNLEAIKGLLRLTQDMPESPQLEKYDEYKALDIICETQPDLFGIHLVSSSGASPEKLLLSAEPSRKTVINALFASKQFYTLIDMLRRLTEMKIEASIHKQFRDIYPYLDSAGDAYQDFQNEATIEFYVRKTTIAVLEDITKTYMAQHQAELDNALQDYKEQVESIRLMDDIICDPDHPESW